MFAAQFIGVTALQHLQAGGRSRVAVLEEVVLSPPMDEFEAITPGRQGGLYHERQREEMISRARTFGRTIEAARRKIARVLTEGLALRIDGGHVDRAGQIWVPVPAVPSRMVDTLQQQGEPVECPCMQERGHGSHD